MSTNVYNTELPMAAAAHVPKDRPASHQRSIDKEKENIQPKEVEANGFESELAHNDVDQRKKKLKIVAKLDSYVCPILIVLQLLSFLDRGNIGYCPSIQIH